MLVYQAPLEKYIRTTLRLSHWTGPTVMTSLCPLGGAVVYDKIIHRSTRLGPFCGLWVNDSSMFQI